jgi:hypothetical protein
MLSASAEPSEPFAPGPIEVVALPPHLDLVDRTPRIFRLKSGVEVGLR